MTDHEFEQLTKAVAAKLSDIQQILGGEIPFVFIGIADSERCLVVENRQQLSLKQLQVTYSGIAQASANETLKEHGEESLLESVATAYVGGLKCEQLDRLLEKVTMIHAQVHHEDPDAAPHLPAGFKSPYQA